MKGKWFFIPATVAVVAIVFLVLRLTVFLPETDSEQETTPSTTSTTTTTTKPVEPTEPTNPADPSNPDEVIQPADPVGPTTNLFFTGKVLEIDGNNVLMESYDKDKFDTVWVTMSQIGADLKVGEEYTIEYEDMMQPSLPPRITAVGFTSSVENPTFISEARAIEVAAEYWGIQPGDRDPETGFMMSIHVMGTPTEENPKYHMALRWLVEVDGVAGNYSTLDTVNVDAVTGEILPVSENGVTQ